jgi:glycosyltransferase involved in cell wall biosynthesis
MQTLRGNVVGQWLIQYTANGQPAGTRNFQHRILTTRPKPTLTVGIIAKDAESDILRCVESIWGLADEILIGDTGSTDNTKAIVSDIRKVRVVDLPSVHEHLDGFAGVRNELLKHATGDWFLWIDTDEILADAPAVAKYLDALVYHGFILRQHHFHLDAPDYADKPVRIVRRRDDIQFYGCIHEQPQMGDCNGDIDPTLLINDAQIAHTGYLTEGVRMRKMSQRNFPLLQKDMARFPDRVLGKVLVLRDLVNLADLMTAQAGRITPEAETYYQRAIGVFEQEFRDPSHRYHKLARPWYESALQHLGVGIEVEAALGMEPGGIQGGGPRPRRLWVRELSDVQRYLAWQVDEIEKRLSPPTFRVDPVVQREAVSA